MTPESKLVLSVILCASLAVTAGCGGSATQPNGLLPAGGQAAPISAGKGGTDLLYVANDSGVAVYTLPEGRFAGRLSDVRATGLCSDQHGNVFLVAQNEVREYAHEGVQPITIFRSLPSGAFRFCSVDPTTGELAVSGPARAGIAIYRDSQAAPQLFEAERQDAGYWSCTYDAEGNLFAERASRNGQRDVELVELAKGAHRFQTIHWNGAAPSNFGAIQWDGEYLAVESAQGIGSTTKLSRYRLDAARAILVDERGFSGARNAAQFSIQRSRIAVSDLGSGREDSAVMLYGYPQGGAGTTIVKAVEKPLALTVSIADHSKFAVTTHHYDNLRTGWNDSEFTLTQAAVRGKSFGLLRRVALDDQVDAQPLVVPDELTTRGRSPGKHDVVYVATENDTVYALDATSGATLVRRNLGKPVPTPLGCTNNGPNVGITSTPVIDLAANVMYLIAYTLERRIPTYRIHELNLTDLSDKVPSVVVTASHQLTNGKTYTFDAAWQRQRPALLESNDNIYAGFGSFCDYAVSLSRGWLIGWHADSLTPLAANRLTDSSATAPDFYFLSAIWMSGYGISADLHGNVFFVTGNSDPSGTTYNGVSNIQESVAKVSPDLTTMLSIFTPSDVGRLDKFDLDLGAGGALLLPPLSNSAPPLAATAGKTGIMFLLNQNNLGGFNRNGPNNDLDEKRIGECWCGLSYFGAGTDSMPRIVASGGTSVTIWKVHTSPVVTLASSGKSEALPTGQDPGFFTTVSSIGGNSGAIIWALTRPLFPPATIELFALSAESNQGSDRLQTLYHGNAGVWRSMNSNANLVPVVANGKVYVASYKQLDIFGIASKGEMAVTTPATGLAALPSRGTPHQVTGTLVRIIGSMLTLQTRTGKTVRVDDSIAVRTERSSDLVVGEPFTASGAYDAAGALHAVLIVRTKPSPSAWPPDR